MQARYSVTQSFQWTEAPVLPLTGGDIGEQLEGSYDIELRWADTEGHPLTAWSMSKTVVVQNP
jgi:hypothetical protein